MSEQKATSHTLITVGMIIGVIVACILIFFGVLFMWAAFDPEGSTGWLLTGAISTGAGLVIIGIAVGAYVYLRRRRAAEGPQEIVQKIDLSGDIALEKMKCQNCSAELDRDSITVKEGAIFVSCPYCGTAYQMVEEPKW